MGARMNDRWIAAATAGLATVLCGLLPPRVDAQAGGARIGVRAENPLPMERRDETIALAWSTLQQQLTGVRADRVRVLDASGHEIVSQVVDEDGDGTPDDLVFQTSFWPGETKNFSVEASPATVKATSRVYVYHDDPRDDVAWESDRIAFRIYGEGLKKTSSAMSSNGIDIWVKSIHGLVIDKWYHKGHDAYHVDTGEGADFYDVGETLGNGGTGVWRNDTLYRGDNFKGWRIIANGPVRAVFELRYDPWNAGGQQVAETKRFVIDGGQNLYRQESVFRVTGGSVGEIPYVIGEVKRPGMVGIMSKAQPWAWLTGWGPVAAKNGGHGEMGSAVLLPADRVVGWKETGDHYLAMSHAKSGEKVVHYIGAGWTASGDFPTPQSWWAYLDDFAKRLASPIKITVGSSTATR
jgi:pectinesterase